MKAGRLRKVGNSLAVLIPAQLRREMNWWESDEMEVLVMDGTVILHNSTKHTVAPITVRRQIGDKRHSSTERSVSVS